MQIVSFLLRILRAAFWICLLFALDVPYLSVFTLLAMLWHELFHLLAFMRIARRARLCTHLSGLRLFPSDVLSYRDERRTAAAGPIGGLFGALLCIVFLPIYPISPSAIFSPRSPIFCRLRAMTAIVFCTQRSRSAIPPMQRLLCGRSPLFAPRYSRSSLFFFSAFSARDYGPRAPFFPR